MTSAKYIHQKKIKEIESYGITLSYCKGLNTKEEKDYYVALVKNYLQQFEEIGDSIWPEIKLDILAHILIELYQSYHWLVEGIQKNKPEKLKRLYEGSKNLVHFVDEYSEQLNRISSIRIQLKGKKVPNSFIVTGSEVIKEIVQLFVSNENKWIEMAKLEEREYLGDEGIALHKKTTLMQLKREAANVLYNYISDPKSSNQEITKTQKYILGGYCMFLIRMIDPQGKEFIHSGEFNNHLYKNFERALDYPTR
jgi:hypothetical protein